MMHESLAVLDAKDARVQKFEILVRSLSVVPKFAFTSFGQANLQFNNIYCLLLSAQISDSLRVQLTVVIQEICSLGWKLTGKID